MSPNPAESAAATLLDRILVGLTRYESVHGVPAEHVRLNRTDYAALSIISPDVTRRPTHIAGREIVQDDRAASPMVGGCIDMSALERRARLFPGARREGRKDRRQTRGGLALPGRTKSPGYESESRRRRCAPEKEEETRGVTRRVYLPSGSPVESQSRR
jgi:hypothetical protein